MTEETRSSFETPVRGDRNEPLPEFMVARIDLMVTELDGRPEVEGGAGQPGTLYRMELSEKQRKEAEKLALDVEDVDKATEHLTYIVSRVDGEVLADAVKRVLAKYRPLISYNVYESLANEVKRAMDKKQTKGEPPEGHGGVLDRASLRDRLNQIMGLASTHFPDDKWALDALRRLLDHFDLVTFGGQRKERESLADELGANTCALVDTPLNESKKLDKKNQHLQRGPRTLGMGINLA